MLATGARSGTERDIRTARGGIRLRGLPRAQMTEMADVGGEERAAGGTNRADWPDRAGSRTQSPCRREKGRPRTKPLSRRVESLAIHHQSPRAPPSAPCRYRPGKCVPAADPRVTTPSSVSRTARVRLDTSPEGSGHGLRPSDTRCGRLDSQNLSGPRPRNLRNL